MALGGTVYRLLTCSVMALTLLGACGTVSADDVAAQAGVSAAPTVSTPVSTATSRTSPGTALSALGALAVKGRAPKTGYARAAFGPAWADLDRNGCDTRNDVLRRDLSRYELLAGTRGCLVLRGTLRDPYTGKTISFVRGPGTSTAVQVDHVVALSDAWQKGAGGWSAPVRARFANDSLNLLAVDGPTNGRKSDADAATWLPPDKGYRCAFVARQVAVKVKYGLWMTAAEKAATARVLTGCLGQKLPVAKAFRLGGGVAQTVRQPVSQPQPANPTYANCTAVRAAGAAPIRAGDPGFEPKFDRDNDGVGCE